MRQASPDAGCSCRFVVWHISGIIPASGGKNPVPGPSGGVGLVPFWFARGTLLGKGRPMADYDLLLRFQNAAFRCNAAARNGAALFQRGPVAPDWLPFPLLGKFCPVNVGNR